MKALRFTLVSLLITTCNFALAQPNVQNRTLTLEQLFSAASATYPSLIASKLEARASAEDVSATERIRWPTITATVESYSGSRSSYPSRSVQMDQILWDFGRNTAKISEAKALADISLLKVYLQQQDVFLQMAGAWQSMIAAHERVKAAKLTHDRLQGFQAQMRRRVEAEAAPRIDLELADARLLQTEVEYTSAQANLIVALSRLEQFSGEFNLSARIQDMRYPSTLGETSFFSQQLKDIDWLRIASDHPVVTKARIEVVQMQRRLDAKKAEALPQVFVRAYKPIGANYAGADTTATTFLGMRYSPGAGFSTYAEAKAIATRLESVEHSVELAIREVQQSLQNDRQEFNNARSRVAALEKSVASSELVLESYQRQFQAGRKQWQDLLNQVRELAQNQYALADAQASMVGSMHRIQIRTGQDPK
jgi:adhesin transport system outer membrane protein